MRLFLTFISIIFLSYNVITSIVISLFYRNHSVFRTELGKSLFKILILTAVHSMYLLLKLYVFKEINIAYTIPFSLLYGSLMYLALKKDHSPDYTPVSKFINFIPFVLVFIFGILCLYFDTVPFFTENNFKRLNYGITSFVYLIYGVLLIKDFVFSIKFEELNDTSIDFSALIAVIMICTSLVNMGFLFFNPAKNTVHSPILLHVILTIAVILIVIKLIHLNKDVDIAQKSVLTINEGEERNNKKYAKSRLDDEQLLAYKKAIESIDNSYFYNSELNLEALEQHLKIKKYYLTQVFSLALNTSFSNYTNKKRIDYAIELLKADPNIKATELTFMVGFSSPQNFNKVFSSIVGITPTKFRKSIKSIK